MSETAEMWSCPDCAFTFDAIHTDRDGGYSCPVCAEARLEAELAQLRTTIAAEIEAYCRPRCDTDHNCCGCSTYYDIVDDAVRIAKGEPDGDA